MKKHEVEGADFYDVQLQRLIRYADQQEKMTLRKVLILCWAGRWDIVLGLFRY